METILTTERTGEAGMTPEAFEHIIAELNTIHQKMQSDDKEIARLSAETEFLKRETRRVAEETRATLTRVENFRFYL